MDDTKNLHVTIISSPGTGHLIPALLLGNRLITAHQNLHVTVIVITTVHSSPAESQLLLNLITASNDHLDIIKLPAPDISNLVGGAAAVVTQLYVMMREAMTGIRSAISVMSPRPDVLIGDIFATELAWQIAAEFGMAAKYAFLTSNAWFTALTAYCHVLDVEVDGQYVDQKEPLKIPGCKPVRPEDVVDPMLDRNDQQYREYVRCGLDLTKYDGLLLNTWQDLEPTTIHALNRHDGGLGSVLKVPVHPVGPLSRPVQPLSTGSRNYVIDWLDMQPSESVVYVSFGSGGTLSPEQITELAWGLELSQQRFVWVVRLPSGAVAVSDASFFTAGTGTSTAAISSYLPEGFLERTQGVGLVVPEWASQVEVLNHRSVGFFLSHCGWNSTLESIASGVPMIAWPLYAEQIMNATILTEELEIAVRPKVLPTKKVVAREEVEEMVRRTLMEGGEMRNKVKKLKESGEEALSIGGSSYNSMCGVIKDCRLKVRKVADDPRIKGLA